MLLSRRMEFFPKWRNGCAIQSLACVNRCLNLDISNLGRPGLED